MYTVVELSRYIILVVCIGDADSVLLSPDEVRPAQEDAGIV